ncbi:MAG: TrmB family transcriptional regulator [Candidatus Kerfeldbacteria bacterium]
MLDYNNQSYIIIDEWQISPHGDKYHHILSPFDFMYTDVLQQIGLSKNEAKIYEALLSLGPSNISSISSVGKVNRRNVYDSMNNLLKRNLVIVLRDTKGKLYKAAEPKRLNEMLQSQKQKISKILPTIKSLYNTKLPAEQAYITRGVEGTKNFWNFVMSQDGPVLFIGGKGAWHDKDLEDERKNYFKTCKIKGIEIKGLFDHIVYQNQKEVYSEYNPEHIRFFPKDYSTSASIDICADRVIMFPMPKEKTVQNTTIFNIVSQPLADSYRKWFDHLWENAIPTNEMKNG